ncbi:MULTISPECIES: glycosyltransferase family 4 protein [Sphingobacterium]|uniref:glycosyltransferase family 4 protein n=1 Tax=Sphingobacterium TaxID=28453 RepID=UPI0013DC5E61|nr:MULTISPECIES: glycosyltransferase family 1 protein [unclassified Sphingobacterium]
MRKVAFFTEILIADFDGASRTMFQLIDRIDNTEFDYFFIYGNGPEQFRNFKSYKVPSFRIPVNEDYCLAIPHFIKAKLESALDEFGPDTIHIATPSLLGFFALNYAKKRGIPVLTIYHTHFISYIDYYFRNMTSLVKPTQHWIKKAMLSFYNRCGITYVPTQSIATELSNIGIDHQKIKIWPRGIDCNLFNPSKSDKSYLRGITGNTNPNILFVSRLVWEKNIKTLIEIYQALEGSGRDYNLMIAGEGTAKFIAMQEMPKAHFLGKQNHEQLSKLYASADAFVFTSTSETYGNVVVEAMASGLPCVIANGGGSASLIVHGISGYKCAPESAQEYVYFLEKIINNSTLRQRFIREGLEFVSQLDWNKLSHQYFLDVQQLSIKSNTSGLAWAN